MKTTFSAIIATVVLSLGFVSPPAQATPLHPEDFSSLGPSPFTTNGTYTIDTSGTTPTLTEPGGASVAGVVFYDGGTNAIAVFTFDTIAVGSNVTINALQNANSRPLALLSQSDITIAGVINVSGANGGTSSGYNAGNGGNAGPGGGGGGASGAWPGFGTAGSGGLGFVSGGNGSGANGGGGGSVVAGGGGTASRYGGNGGAFGGNGGGSFDCCLAACRS